MFGSGALIGTATIRQQHRLILQVLLQALIACFAAALGTSVPRTAVWLVASSTRPTTAAAISVGGFAPFSVWGVTDLTKRAKKKKFCAFSAALREAVAAQEQPKKATKFSGAFMLPTP